MKKSNYDKYPATEVEGKIWIGWDNIIKHILHCMEEKHIMLISVECYHGVDHIELISQLSKIEEIGIINTEECFKSEEEINNITNPYLTEDSIFGKRSYLSLYDYLDQNKVNECHKKINHLNKPTLIYGYGSSLIAPNAHLQIYADMPRWEIQKRFRNKEINGIGVYNKNESPSYHYKRGYFLDWVMCDNIKKQIFEKVDFWLDSHIHNNPKMIDRTTMFTGLDKTVHQPFRVVPFFDPAPWGGQWMKKVCNLDGTKDNYGWCFDCVPEENSLNLKIQDELYEMPSVNLVFHKTKELLGEAVESRFGEDFPIRFDFLDTIDGGNLSLQVHPTTQYIRDNFGIYYTQDESYYILDSTPEANVFLGLKNKDDYDKMIRSLKKCYAEKINFDVEKYINKWPAKKHDHFLIPSGTIHCSGKGTMVLEISATPSIFTFKLWDWNRVGLDGLPRPINIEHGSNVIDKKRDTQYTQEHLINQIQVVDSGEDWVEERTGLHQNEFIETRRHWFSSSVLHQTNGSVNVLNVIEGEELIIKSPTNAFEPYTVHYAETFIIPACINEYVIAPSGNSIGKVCGTIKAYVRFK